jgi:hypothetical protein
MPRRYQCAILAPYKAGYKDGCTAAYQAVGAEAGQQLPPRTLLPARPAGRTLPARTEMGWTTTTCVGGSSATMRTNTPLLLQTGARCARRGGFAAAAEHLRGSPRHRRPGVGRAGRYRPCYHPHQISQSLKLSVGVMMTTTAQIPSSFSEISLRVVTGQKGN